VLSERMSGHNGKSGKKWVRRGTKADGVQRSGCSFTRLRLQGIGQD
jgi:hypothetical protein